MFNLRVALIAGCLSLSACAESSDSVEGSAGFKEAQQPASPPQTIALVQTKDTNPKDEPEARGNKLHQPKSKSRQNSYIFGHSLINHGSSSTKTSVPEWMGILADASGLKYEVSGSFGFLSYHSARGAWPQWGFPSATASWNDDDGLSFADVDFDNVILTPANFIQDNRPANSYDGHSPSPVEETLKIIDWVTSREPGLQIYIYENWPDMGPYADPFPPSQSKFHDYHAFTLGHFHDWFIEYHDELVRARPNVEIKMLPVGPIISKLLLTEELKHIPAMELYEDNAPHGYPSIYYLAALITYSATYGQPAPNDFNPGKEVHSDLRRHQDMIIDFIWDELRHFSDKKGRSRVW